MMVELRDRLENLRRAVERDLEAAAGPTEVEAIRVRALGRKGSLTGEAKAIGALAPEERPAAGELVNRIKGEIEAAIEARERTLAETQLAARLEAERLDVTLPGRRRGQGTRHPITIVTDELIEIFRRMGFEVATGPEAETTWHNFEALNIPPGHPAREEMDTLYISDEVVLRTHTSPVQIRVMEERDPPVRIVCPGRVFRSDTPDASHSPYFHQIEGLWVDEGISLAHLKWALTEFVHRYFGPQIDVRFRPSYFPFTEPSAELDMGCLFCRGAGCRVCKGTGWMELLGCGMVHPAVLEAVGTDSERYTGFAWGLGVDRIAMLKHGVGDIRLFFENDVRFLHQFAVA
ncbi:MAG TPA: phenylalanine--tRNA ligase subunit alpha [Gemmatimonadota bacterium]|nr:phenylalanine--tRNA ligase subunit alpha [Gemmatimonadota bacterium]